MRGCRPMLGVALTLVGTAMILVAFVDIFWVLFVPTRRGAVSGTLSRLVWRIVRAVSIRDEGRAWLIYAGPLALSAIILSWVSLLTIGWALIYVAPMPESYVITQGVPPEARSGIITAIHFSATVLSGTGLGDLSPTTGGLRLVTVVESLTGTALITAGVTWLLSIYPAVGRQRTLAERISTAGEDRGSSEIGPTARELDGLAGQVARCRADIAKFPIVYYFAEKRPYADLPCRFGLAYELADTALESDDAEVRRAGGLLQSSLDNLMATIAEEFELHVDPSEPRAVCDAVGIDHRCAIDT